LKTKLPRYNDDDDVEECQYVWQENELAQLTLDNGCRETVAAADGEWRAGKRPGSTYGTALLL